MPHSWRALIIALIGTHLSQLSAEELAQEPNEPAAFASWNNLAAPALSDDGLWVAYTLSNASGSQQLVVRGTRDVKEYRSSRGSLPLGRTLEEETMLYERMLRPTQFTADSRYVVFSIAPRSNEASNHIATADQPKVHPSILQDLGILRIADGRLTVIPHVAAYSVPRGSGRYLAYVARVSTADTLISESYDSLVLRDLDTGVEVRMNDVTDFVFDDKGQYLAYAVSSKQPGQTGVYVRRLADAQVRIVATGGRSRGLVFDPSGDQLAFLMTQDGARYSSGGPSVYRAKGLKGKPECLLDADVLPDGTSVDPDAGIRFTTSGKELVFGLRVVSEMPLSASTNRNDVNEAKLELWHWRDPGGGATIKNSGPRRIPSNTKKEEAYLALYHIDERRWVQLGTIPSSQVLLSESGRFAVGIDDAPYRLQRRWTREAFDIFLIDPKSGTPTLFRRGINARYRMTQEPPENSYFTLSPTGKFLIYFENGRWWSLDLETKKLSDLTGSLLPDIRFDYGDTINMFDGPPGVAAWMSADERIFLYSWHDIWEVDPSGNTPPRNVTGSIKRANLVFRLWADNWDDVFGASIGTVLANGSNVLLLAANESTKASSVWQFEIGSAAPPELLFEANKRIVPVARAGKSTQFLLTMETLSDYPDLWTGKHISRLTKISDANPQQRDFRWGSVEQVEFSNDVGAHLKGLLYKPEGFDLSRRYPMIVRIYTRFSPGLHQHRVSTSSNIPAPAAFTSRDYLYFMPDIQHRGPDVQHGGAHVGSPYIAQSALGAVLPAVDSIIERGFVDETRIGLIGDSFGGYEISAIISQSTRFRCAVIIAGVVDSIAYYGALTGFGQSFVEVGQLAHGGSIWERPFAYIANSPLLYADDIRIPVLQMHNDHDNAVPFAQGMAFFFALQRNSQPVWLVNYPGEGHGVERYANKLDWSRRVIQFLDHYLRESPMPTWMH